MTGGVGHIFIQPAGPNDSPALVGLKAYLTNIKAPARPGRGLASLAGADEREMSDLATSSSYTLSKW